MPTGSVRHLRLKPGRRPSANPGRLLTGRGLRNVLRLGGCTVVRLSRYHVLIEYGGRRVTVPMLKGEIPNSTLRAIAKSLETSGGVRRTWRHLYT